MVAEKGNNYNPNGARGLSDKARQLRGQTSKLEQHDYVNPPPLEGEVPVPDEVLPGAVDHFKCFANSAQAIGVLSECDLSALAVLANNYYLHIKWQNEAAEHPMVFGARDNEVANPLWRMAKDAGAVANRLMAEFGLSPRARTKLGKPECEVKRPKAKSTVTDISDFSGFGRRVTHDRDN